jgi:hypothetical protein
MEEYRRRCEDVGVDGTGVAGASWREREAKRMLL